MAVILIVMHYGVSAMLYLFLSAAFLAKALVKGLALCSRVRAIAGRVPTGQVPD